MARFGCRLAALWPPGPFAVLPLGPLCKVTVMTAHLCGFLQQILAQHLLPGCAGHAAENLGWGALGGAAV